jgi:molybdate transport system substrate-binding protein
MNEAIRMLAAGSLRHAMPEIAAAFERDAGILVSLTLGPAGLLREQIEAGEPFDLFASANMAHPDRLVALGLAEETTCFIQNRLCILARADLGLTAENLVEVLSAPTTRIGTSTPGDDPSGDYAFEMFDLLEAQHPGRGMPLKHRAQQLVGGRNSPPGRSAVSLIGEGVVDVFLGYASNARLHEKNPKLSIIELPSKLAPRIEYGVALRSGASGAARALRDLLLLPYGQDLFEARGFQQLHKL